MTMYDANNCSLNPKNTHKIVIDGSNVFIEYDADKNKLFINLLDSISAKIDTVKVYSNNKAIMFDRRNLNK